MAQTDSNIHTRTHPPHNSWHARVLKVHWDDPPEAYYTILVVPMVGVGVGVGGLGGGMRAYVCSSKCTGTTPTGGLLQDFHQRVCGLGGFAWVA